MELSRHFSDRNSGKEELGKEKSDVTVGKNLGIGYDNLDSKLLEKVAEILEDKIANAKKRQGSFISGDLRVRDSAILRDGPEDLSLIKGALEPSSEEECKNAILNRKSDHLIQCIREAVKETRKDVSSGEKDNIIDNINMGVLYRLEGIAGKELYLARENVRPKEEIKVEEEKYNERMILIKKAKEALGPLSSDEDVKNAKKAILNSGDQVLVQGLGQAVKEAENVETLGETVNIDRKDINLEFLQKVAERLEDAQTTARTFVWEKCNEGLGLIKPLIESLKNPKKTSDLSPEERIDLIWRSKNDTLAQYFNVVNNQVILERRNLAEKAAKAAKEAAVEAAAAKAEDDHYAQIYNRTWGSHKAEGLKGKDWKWRLKDWNWEDKDDIAGRIFCLAMEWLDARGEFSKALERGYDQLKQWGAHRKAEVDEHEAGLKGDGDAIYLDEYKQYYCIREEVIDTDGLYCDSEEYFNRESTIDVYSYRIEGLKELLDGWTNSDTNLQSEERSSSGPSKLNASRDKGIIEHGEEAQDFVLDAVEMIKLARREYKENEGWPQDKEILEDLRTYVRGFSRHVKDWRGANRDLKKLTKELNSSIEDIEKGLKESLDQVSAPIVYRGTGSALELTSSEPKGKHQGEVALPTDDNSALATLRKAIEKDDRYKACFGELLEKTINR